jgi:hypothetical protein
MCIKAEKITFCSGFGTQVLVYLQSTGFDKFYRVINEANNCNILSDSMKQKLEYGNLNQDDIYIDNQSGDIF